MLVIVRQNFRGKGILNAIIDMPFAISPVVIGLSLIFVYGSVDGWFGPWLAEQGIQVIFSPVGMAIATIFVSLPFVVREVIPVLEEIGDDQEQAASTLGANLSGLARHGRIVVIGVSGSGPKGDINLLNVMQKHARISGSTLRARPLEEKAAAMRLVEKEVLPHFADGTLKVPVAETFELDRVADAYDRFTAGGKLGKIVLLP